MIDEIIVCLDGSAIAASECIRYAGCPLLLYWPRKRSGLELLED
jgi:hypothetical protein